jgi:hypothetical protein
MEKKVYTPTISFFHLFTAFCSQFYPLIFFSIHPRQSNIAAAKDVQLESTTEPKPQLTKWIDPPKRERN